MNLRNETDANHALADTAQAARTVTATAGTPLVEEITAPPAPYTPREDLEVLVEFDPPPMISEKARLRAEVHLLTCSLQIERSAHRATRNRLVLARRALRGVLVLVGLAGLVGVLLGHYVWH